MSAPTINLDSPASLIAAIPAVFGFSPEESVVLVTLAGGQLGAVMRVDLGSVLEVHRSNMLATGLAPLIKGVVNSAAEQVITLIVTASPDDAGMHKALAVTLGDLLSARNVDLVATLTVDRIDDGGRWHCACGCGDGGVIDNPKSSVVAMAAVLEGRRVNATRDELIAVIAPSNVVDVSAGDLDGWTLGEKIEYALNAITRGVPDDYAVMAHIVNDIAARDALLALALTDFAEKSEAMWLELSRRLPGPYRAAALTLFAYSLYCCRGDGTLAGIALRAATATDPTYVLAGLISAALQSGVPRERIRELAEAGYRVGLAAGVEMPAWVRA